MTGGDEVPELDLHDDGLGSDPARGLWGIYAVAVWAIAFFAPILVGFVVLAVGGDAVMAGAASTPIVGVLLASGTVWATRRLQIPLAAIGWRRPDNFVRDGLLAVGVAVAVIGVDVLNSLVLSALGLPTDTLAPFRDLLASPFLIVMLLLGAVVAAPFGEEMYFRGMLLSMFGVRMRRWVAICAAALLFTVAHFSTLSAWAPLFVFALMLGWLRVHTRSLFAPILAHLLNNVITVTFLIAGAV